MKILFIASGNKTFGISPIVKNQYKSLIDYGLEIQLFLIEGKGFSGYLKNLFPLILTCAQNKPDIIHAHYSLSGFLTFPLLTKPKVVSLMGSDIKSKNLYKHLINLFYRFIWKKTIVKSEDLKQSLNLKNAIVIPNGVNTSKFHPGDKTEARKKLKWPHNESIILFPSDPNRPEKNYNLLQSAIGYIKKSVQIKTMVDIPNEEVVHYYNAADVVVLPSLWEGSPNAVKEAMACNRPIVATPVGDIPLLLNGAEGTFITQFDEKDFANNISKALEYKSSKGRVQITNLGITSDQIAQKLIQVYQSTLGK